MPHKDNVDTLVTLEIAEIMGQSDDSFLELLAEAAGHYALEDIDWTLVGVASPTEVLIRVTGYDPDL